MMSAVRRTGVALLLAVTLGLTMVVIGPALAGAVEVDQPAPDFRLPSTTGGEISLGDFRGKKWVFLEFYGADFVPT
jgi:AhpC/TSA family